MYCDYKLVKKNLKHTQGKFKKICEKRVITILWVTTPTKNVDISLYSIILKIAELLDAGCNITILVSYLHTLLLDKTSNETEISDFCKDYINKLNLMLEGLGLNQNDITAQITFTTGQEFQFQPHYTKSFYTLYRKGIKDTDIITDLDIQSIEHDAQLVTNIQDITSDKKRYLVAEKQNIGINITDKKKIIKKKIGNVDIELVMNIIFPALKRLKKKFTIFRREEDGGSISVKKQENLTNIEELDAEKLLDAIIYNVNIVIETARKRL